MNEVSQVKVFFISKMRSLFRDARLHIILVESILIVHVNWLCHTVGCSFI